MNAQSFLYVSVHPREPRFKVGKANDPWARWDSLHLDPDPARSRLVEGPTRDVFRLEKVLHFMLRPWRADVDTTLDGHSEWFTIEALPRAYEVITNLLRTHARFRAADWPARPAPQSRYQPAQTEPTSILALRQFTKCLDDGLPVWARFLDGVARCGHIHPAGPAGTGGSAIAFRSRESGDLNALREDARDALAHPVLVREPTRSACARFVTWLDWETDDAYVTALRVGFTDLSNVIRLGRQLGSGVTRLQRLSDRRAAVVSAMLISGAASHA